MRAASVKERLLAEIDGAELVQLSSELGRIRSFTTEETPVAHFVHKLLASHGFESELHEVEPGRLQTIARWRGRDRGQSLMLNGHLDIDPIPEGWMRDPWAPSLEGDRLYGAGIYNMKGGLAAMLGAALAARRADVTLRGDLVLACVVGELQGGVGTLHALRNGLRADVAVVPEPFGIDNVVTKHTGATQLLIHVLGRTAHISRKHQGVNAISLMCDVVRELEHMTFRGAVDLDLPDLPLLQIGSIVGGRGRHWELRGPAIVPDVCSVIVDVRFAASMTPESVLDDIRAAVSRAIPGGRYEVECPARPERRVVREWVPPLTMAIDHPLAQTLRRNIREVSGVEPRLGAVVPYSYASSDAAHLFAAGIPACLFGPTGGYDEARADRWTSVSQIVTCARVLGGMIVDVCA